MTSRRSHPAHYTPWLKGAHAFARRQVSCLPAALGAMAADVSNC